MKTMRMIVAVVALSSVAQLAVGQVTADRAREEQQRDQLRIAVQQICPVSGKKLGAMGEPVKAQVGEETVFLCCKGCLNGKINPEYWATIHANFAKAQRICPVSKRELPAKPKWTIVEGEVIYVCCPSCTNKITAAPEKYLRAVDGLYAASLDARTKRR